MNSCLKKRVCVLSAAVILSVSLSYAASPDNKIIDIQFKESGGDITATIITEKGYSVPIKAVKSGSYYNIILPNLDKGEKSRYTPNNSNIQLVKVSTLPSSTGGGSYTKVSIKVASGISLSAESKVVDDEYLKEAEKKAEQQTTQPKKTTIPEEEENLPVEDTTAETEETFTEENSNYTEEKYEDENFEQTDTVEKNIPIETNQNPQSPNVQTQTTYNYTPSNAKQNHTSEILYFLISSAAIILVIVLLYIKGKDRMHELCGDMGINLDLDDKKTKKQPEKEKKEAQRPAKSKLISQAAPLKNIEELNYNSYSTASFQLENNSSANTSAYKEEEPEEPEQTIINLDEIYSGPIASAEPSPAQAPENVQEQPTETISDNIITQAEEVEKTDNADDEEDIDAFLASFVDADEEETPSDNNNETAPVSEENAAEQTAQTEAITHNQTSNQPQELEREEPDLSKDSLSDTQETDDELIEEAPVEELIDEVITTQNMSFTDEDVAALEAKLQADLSLSLLKQTSFSPDNAIANEKYTVEEFDKQYPMLSDKVIDEIINNDNILFNDIDLNVIFSPITSYEMSEDAILEAQLRKEKEDEENIQYYENEKDFAFTLIKPQDMENADDLVVLDNNLYPDLENVDFSNDEIFKEFSFVKPNAPEANIPSNEDIDKAIEKEMELINNQKGIDKAETDDDVLSEFKLIKPDVEKVKDTQDFSTTIFTSMDDIEAQFKALGIDFSVDKNKNAEETLETVEELEDKPIELPSALPEETTTNTEYPAGNSTDESFQEEADIYATCKIDFSTELYIAPYNNKIALLGMKNGVIKHLHDFEPGNIPATIKARKAENTENGQERYIVRADKEKFVIDVSDNDIKLVLIL